MQNHNKKTGERRTRQRVVLCVIVIVFQNSTTAHTEDHCTVRCGPVFLQLNSWMFPTSIKLIQCVYLKWFSNKNSDMMSKLDKNYGLREKVSINI